MGSPTAARIWASKNRGDGIVASEPSQQPANAIRAESDATAPPWARYPDEKLLDLRLCDLGLRIQGTWLAKRIKQVRSELRRKNIDFRPHFWLSDEWYSPHGVPGVAIPFYLAHPRLMKLEEKLMLDVEGGTVDWCLRLLRHELGHAIDDAYRLHRRPAWRQVFGKFSQPYPDYYQPKPYSKRFVLHLDYWYAQSHPSEDFAETFAVWLTPGSQWRKRYKGWPALKKLEFVDALMTKIAGTPPPVQSRSRTDTLRSNRLTLREHYEKKRAHYGVDYPDFYDRDLRRLFSESPDHAGNPPAASFLRKIRRELRKTVARWTGQRQYTIDQVIGDMIERCQELKLRMDRPEEQARMDATIVLTVQTMNYLHSGFHRLAI